MLQVLIISVYHIGSVLQPVRVLPSPTSDVCTYPPYVPPHRRPNWTCPSWNDLPIAIRLLVHCITAILLLPDGLHTFSMFKFLSCVIDFYLCFIICFTLYSLPLFIMTPLYYLDCFTIYTPTLAGIPIFSFWIPFR